MPIMRKQKVNRYTTVDNYLIDDKRLDPEGKGYLIKTLIVLLVFIIPSIGHINGFLRGRG